MNSIKIGLIGCGTVGSGVVELLSKNRDLIASRTGIFLDLKKIAIHDTKKKRSSFLNQDCLTSNPEVVVSDPQIQIVAELMGGIHPAKELILKALRSGKHVVTANKALLAQCGQELFEVANQYQRHLFFEASVGGGIPVIKGLREGLVGNHLKAIYGIVNGTSNFILSKMSLEGVDFQEALKEAKKLGYAEANPRFDLEGIDSAHKLVILTSLAYGHWIPLKKVYTEGITKITAQDIERAREFGYVIKLLAIAKDKGDAIEAHVHPTLISRHHSLSSVNGVYNAIFYEGDFVGQGLLYGKGAGAGPTASAVVSDIVDAAKKLGDIKIDFEARSLAKSKNVESMDELIGRSYLRFSALDQPGVLAKIAGVLGKHGISISSVIQKERHASGAVPVVVMTHQAKEKNFREAIEKIDQMDAIRSKTLRIRVEEEGVE